MSKSQILQKEISEGIKKIESLSKNDNIKVYDIFLSVYEKFKELPKEEFINEYYFGVYKKIISRSKKLFENELKSLIENTVETNSSDNFFQIKISMLMMSPEKLTNSNS